MSDSLKDLVRRYLPTRIADAWYIVMATEDGKALICPHVYSRERAERIANVWREVLHDVEVVILEPNSLLDRNEG